MRVLFMGTPAFAAASLEALLHSGSFDIAGVVTQPDRPKGRGMTLQPSEVKLVSIQAGLPLWQPSRVADAEFMEIFEQINTSKVCGEFTVRKYKSVTCIAIAPIDLQDYYFMPNNTLEVSDNGDLYQIKCLENQIQIIKKGFVAAEDFTSKISEIKKEVLGE